ncbi:sensor histidine kinase [Nonomuraea typhae]|uniref:sensor histidine kinase n=1 Tax=Nonomuraea typhae TaxID=2603600 RepID=UPI0012F78260|nr:histidine kinase [Nonomuraea typhae]
MRLARVGQVLLLLAMAVVQVVAFAATLAAVVLTFTLGLVFLFPPAVLMTRRLAEQTRRWAREWAGVLIESPYLPKPPPPQRGPDGFYRHDRTLYKTPRVPAWSQHWMWLVGDGGSWRDMLWLLWDPFVKVILAPLLLTLPKVGLYVYAHWARLLLAPTAASRLAVQVQQLKKVRSLANDTQAAEMRRIERDLHDGTQARLVALGMTLGAVEQLIETNPAAAKALLAKARDASSETLTELRRVVRGIHPPVLAERGLADAVRAMAMDSPLHVEIEVDLPNRAESPVEAAAYFAVSELLSNAARHGNATRVRVDLSQSEEDLRITVEDDGMGGADPAKGSGLAGIERRLAAFDGVLAVHSPPGGPTTVTMNVPRALPDRSPNGDKARLPLWKTGLTWLLWLTAWCPLFPQGLVAAILKFFEVDVKSWFVAFYLPEQWQWPFIMGMILLGASMYLSAVLIPATHSKERWMAEATPRRLWLRRC